MSAEVVSIRQARPRVVDVPSRNPLVMRWRRQADDLYCDPSRRSVLRACARELELAERGELDARYEDDDDTGGVS